MTAAAPGTGLFSRSGPEVSRIGLILRHETVGGGLLLGAAAIALIWANTPLEDSYTALRDARIGPSALHLDLTLGTWAADGLLAIFFFVAGLELKREFIAGDLREPRRAAVPIAAAFGGVLVPALVYLAVTQGAGGGLGQGWAIPTATDIAFALAVLAVIGSNLPPALRTFLLTLAVVDDLLAITIIATFYTDDLRVLPLLAAIVPLVAFAALMRQGRWHWLGLGLALLTWVLVHESGVHATVAGVALALTVPVVGRTGDGEKEEGPGLAERLEHRIRPLSAGFAVPVFAFFAAGVALGGLDGLTQSLSQRVAVAIVVALVVGKTVGIVLATWLVARFTHAALDDSLSWLDVLAVAMLGGMGFTVSLLIAELAFPSGTAQAEPAKIAVIAGSLAAALIAAVLLRLRSRAYARIQDVTDLPPTSVTMEG